MNPVVSRNIASMTQNLGRQSAAMPSRLGHAMMKHGNRYLPSKPLPAGARRRLKEDAENLLGETVDPVATLGDPDALSQASDIAYNHEASGTSTPGWLNRDVDLADKISSKAAMAAMFVPMGLGASGWALEKVGAHAAKAKVDKVSGATIGQVGGLLGPVGRGIESLNTGLTGMLSKATDKLHEWGFTEKKAMRYKATAVGYMDRLSHPISHVMKAEGHSPKLTEALNLVRDQLNKPTLELEVDKLREAAKAAKTLAKKEDRALFDALKQIEKYVPKLHKSEYLADGWKNLSEHVRNTPTKMKKVNAMHGMMNAAFITGAATSDYFTLSSIATKLHDFKEMVADFQDKDAKKISIVDLATSRDPVVKKVFHNFAFESLVTGALDTVNTYLNVKFVMHPPHGMLGWLPVMILPMASQMLRGVIGSKVLPAYHVIKEAHEHGEKAPAIAYAELLANCCEPLKQRGGIQSHFTIALAEKMANDQLSAKEVLHRIHSHEVEKEIVNLQYSQMQKERNPHAAQPAEAKVEEAKVEEVDIPKNHVEKLKNGNKENSDVKEIKENKEAMHPRLAPKAHEIVGSGKFTGKFATEQGAERQL